MARLRYRKSVKLPGGFRINVSTKGVGYSWGVKGARITKRVDGQTTFTGNAPGTGLSFQQTLSKKLRKVSVGTRQPVSATPLTAGNPQVIIWRPDYWTGFIGNFLIPGLGMAHIQAYALTFGYFIAAVIATYLFGIWGWFTVAMVCLFHYRSLYTKGEFSDFPLVVNSPVTSSYQAPIPPVLAQQMTLPALGLPNEIGKPPKYSQALIDWDLYFDASWEIDELSVGQYAHLIPEDIIFPGCIVSQTITNNGMAEFGGTTEGVAKYIFFIMLKASEKFQRDLNYAIDKPFSISTDVFLSGPQRFIIQPDTSTYLIIMTPSDALQLNIYVR